MNMFMGRPILVGMPLAPNHQSDTRIITLLESLDRKDNVETFYAPSSDVTLGRDRIVQFANYRVPRPTHILFVDHDVLPRKNTLEKLLEHDKDIVAGVYPMVQKGKLSWCLSREDPFIGLPIDDLPKNLFKTKFVGCGMMLVKMEVFDKLEWPYWKNEFAPGVHTLGEDLYFCQKARDTGYDVWVDPLLKCNHFRQMDLLNIAMNYIKKGTK